MVKKFNPALSGLVSLKIVVFKFSIVEEFSCSVGLEEESSLAPPPRKKRRSCLEDEKMQQSNGVPLQNGSQDNHNHNNGSCYGQISALTSPDPVILDRCDQEIVRLIGQYLETVGLK